MSTVSSALGVLFLLTTPGPALCNSSHTSLTANLQETETLWGQGLLVLNWPPETISANDRIE